MFNNQFKVGDVAKVKIVKLMTFGAFAEIIPGVDGLIHISQIADRRIGKPEDVLSEGQEVDAKIIDIDQEHKRISLSIRALLSSRRRGRRGRRVILPIQAGCRKTAACFLCVSQKVLAFFLEIR